ncbi:thiamine phosphate synthase [Oricola cellulosilytica]|uniref:Thiamine phosphate synthase n=1 Tax=Oricola cellulosilytica TaxID=1429082 RepID=A0A4R0P7K1_9HYPH|nr:thiamine phosphate synthase [Oricola cellulosilytica]TCD11459.1 thiamine phosphate synthase [Oricola cellulosilytica]
MTHSVTDRCRLVLVVPKGLAGADLGAALKDALSGGDVASVILPAYDLDDAAFQRQLEACVPIAQDAGAAAIVAEDTRAFGRVGADGIHLSGGPAEVAEAVEKSAGRHIVGASAGDTRHRALEIGEARPDYLLFGRFGQDTHPEPYRKNLALAEWWSAIVEIPGVVMGGADLATLGQAAGTGVEFVALSRAIFEDVRGAGAAVAAANDVLEKHPLAEEA